MFPFGKSNFRNYQIKHKKMNYIHLFIIIFMKKLSELSRNVCDRNKKGVQTYRELNELGECS